MAASQNDGLRLRLIRLSQSGHGSGVENDLNAQEISATVDDFSISRASRSENHSPVADARLRPYGRSRGAASRLPRRTRSRPQRRTILGQSLSADLENESEVSAAAGFKPLAGRLLRQRAAMSEISHTRKNSPRRRLTVRATLYKIDTGGSRKGSKGNAVRVLGARYTAAAPATVSGESSAGMTTGMVKSWEGGRRQRPASQDICHQQRVTRERVGRGVLA